MQAAQCRLSEVPFPGEGWAGWGQGASQECGLQQDRPSTCQHLELQTHRALLTNRSQNPLSPLTLESPHFDPR